MAPKKKAAETSAATAAVATRHSTRVTKGTKPEVKSKRTVDIAAGSAKMATCGGSNIGGQLYDAPDIMVAPECSRPSDTLRSVVAMDLIDGQTAALLETKKTGKRQRASSTGTDKPVNSRARNDNSSKMAIRPKAEAAAAADESDGSGVEPAYGSPANVEFESPSPAS